MSQLSDFNEAPARSFSASAQSEIACENVVTLNVNNLHVYRRKRHILDGISFEARKGEVLGLIGANGSGKSTLLKTILNILPKAEGEIYFMGSNVDELERRAIAKRMAYMAQENECRWPLTVERVVALGRMPHQAPWQSLNEDDREVVNDSMRVVGIEHLASRTVTRLSGGERHRVLFARALATEPEILLADEPTAGLDPYHQLNLMELFRLQAIAGKTVVVVLHDLVHASRFCDRLVLLKDGVVLAQGSTQEVLNNDNLKSGYGIEAQTFLNNGETSVIPWSCSNV